MSATLLRAVGAGLFFLGVFLSGFWLSRSGRPLNMAISTLHKLVSLAASVFLVMTIVRLNTVTPLSAIEWIAIVVTGLLFLGDAATGAILSTDNPVPPAVLRLHQIIPFLTLISTAVMLYLLLGRT
jgi:hypothetical protein